MESTTVEMPYQAWIKTDAAKVEMALADKVKTAFPSLYGGGSIQHRSCPDYAGRTPNVIGTPDGIVRVELRWGGFAGGCHHAGWTAEGRCYMWGDGGPSGVDASPYDLTRAEKFDV